MANVFLEIIVDAAEALAIGIDSRDELEDPLEDALSASSLGELSGGGGGKGIYILDVDVDEQKFEQALALIRQVLKTLNVPRSTRIKRHTPTKIEFSVYE